MQQRILVASVVAGALAFGFVTTAAAGGNIAAGKKKATVCEACHGKNGNGTSPQYPALAGQYDNYLVRALHEYKDGRRKNAIMNAMAKPLTNQDINDLAAFFSSMPSKLSSLHGKIQGSHDEILHNP